jgi:uncharacterized protein YggE
MSKPKTHIASFLLAGIVGLSPVSWVAADDKSPVPTITVIGSGKVSAQPDQGRINVGVVTQRQAAADAMHENNMAMRKVFKTLADVGIAAKDIQTTNLTLNQVYARRDKSRSQPKIVGYEVTNQVRVVVRDLAKIGDVLDAVVQEGANRLNGVSFAVADPTDLLDDARRKAIQDARRKAELYALAAGVKLGAILAIQEGQAPVPRQQQFRLAQAAESVPIAPGQLNFAIHITVNYGIDTKDTK